MKQAWFALSIIAVLAASTPLSAAEVFGLSLEALSPKAAQIEVIPSEDNQVQAVVARHDGPGLPAIDSIVIGFAAPQAVRAHASAIVPRDRHWAVPRWTKSLSGLPELTQYAVWETPDRRYGVMVNMAGGGMISYLQGGGPGIIVKAHSHMQGYAPDRVPMFAIGYGDDPYLLTRDVYAHALSVMKQVDPQGVIGNLRRDKPYPEIFQYLGWCSWNAHYTDATHDKLVQNAKSLRAKGIPVNWMIIDDGWETLMETTTKLKKKRGMSLAGFTADPQKFPEGLEGVARDLKAQGVKHVAVWNTINGYWNGIAINSPLGRDYQDALMKVSDEVALPDPRDDSGFNFWDAFFSYLTGQGIDFVKIDDQSTQYDFTEGIIPVSHSYAGTQRNFQKAADKYFGHNVINCMSMNVDTIYQWEYTNIARASRDYYPDDPFNPRAHNTDCVYNSMWFENLAWPDFDMWQTHNHHREYNAITRAVSGGPVYIGDKAGLEIPQHVTPLALADGKLIRTDEPARPTRKSLFTNPYASPRALTAFSPAGKGGAVAAWNMNMMFLPVVASISPADVEGIEGTNFAVYEYYSRKLWKVQKEEEIKQLMKPWDARLYSVQPIEHDFAPIGLVNKYVPVATIELVEIASHAARLVLVESGPFAAYAERMPSSITANGETLDMSLVTLDQNLLAIDLPAQAGKVELKICW